MVRFAGHAPLAGEPSQGFCRIRPGRGATRPDVARCGFDGTTKAVLIPLKTGVDAAMREMTVRSIRSTRSASSPVPRISSSARRLPGGGGGGGCGRKADEGDHSLPQTELTTPVAGD